MELNERKYINNTKELPGFSRGYLSYNGQGITVNGKNESSSPGFFGAIGNAIGTAGKAIGSAASATGKFLGKDNKVFGTNGAAIAAGAVGALGMINDISAAGKYNKTADDLLQDAGTSQLNIGGVGYTVLNGVDQAREAAEVNAESTSSTIGLVGSGASTGAAIGSLAGPIGSGIGAAVGAVGGLIGGLIGGGAKKREMKRQMKLAEIKRINQNDFNRSGALTTVMQNNLAETEGDQTQLTLYGAANGKPSYSAGGPTTGYNARVSNGEIIANKFTGEMFRVPGLPNNKDGKLAFIRPSDTIITNKYGLSDYVAETGDLEGGEAMMSSIMKTKGAKGYKCGKLPGFKWGLPEWTNFGVNAFGALTSAADAASIDSEAISRPNTYAKNALQNEVLGTLKNLRYNVYPIIPEVYNQMGKGIYAINNAGGMGGGQRNLSRLAAMQSAYDTTAKLFQDAQAHNAKYAMAYADAAANLGNEDAKRWMQAAQFDYDAYNQAHGAKRMMVSQRKADAMNYLNNWAKGLTDMHMWRRMMDNYDREFDADHPKSTSTNAPKIQLDPNSLFGNTNFAGTKSYGTNPLAGTVEAGRPLPEFTAPTPREIDRFKNHQMLLLNAAFPQYWTTLTDKSYLDISPISKLPVSSTKSTVKPTTSTKTEKKSKSTKTSADVPDWYVMPKNAGSEYYRKRYGSDEAAREAYWKLYKYWENNK